MYLRIFLQQVKIQFALDAEVGSLLHDVSSDSKIPCPGPKDGDFVLSPKPGTQRN